MVFFGHVQLRHFRLRHTFAFFRGYLTLTWYNHELHFILYLSVTLYLVLLPGTCYTVHKPDKGYKSYRLL